MDPGNPNIVAGLLRCLLQLQKMDDVNELLSSLNEEILNNQRNKKVKKLLDNFQNSNDGSSIDELKLKFDKDPTNKELRYKLAEKYISLNKIDNGFSLLLSILKMTLCGKKRLLKKNYWNILIFWV